MRRLLATVATAAAALVLAGCGDDDIELHARFDDVVDLTVNGTVKVADVDVGRIARIELDEGNRALVTLEVDGDRAIPRDSVARLRKTGVLGERYVELAPGEAPQALADGDEIAQTQVVPELEEAIATGTEVVAAVATDVLAGAIDAGAEGLDGRGETLGSLLDDLTAVVSTYDTNSDDLVRLIDGLSEFLGEAGPQAHRHGEALAEVEEFFRVLDEEDDRVLDALSEARALARTGTDIMDTHRQRIDNAFMRLDAIAGEVAAREATLDRIWADVAQHNVDTFRGIRSEFAQIVLDMAICEVNTTPGDAVRACDDPPQGRPIPQPRPPQDF